MKTLNTPILFIVTLAVFLALAWYSQHLRIHRQANYDTEGVARLIDAYKPLTKAERLKHDQAKTLREVYMIKAGDENLNIFGE